MSEPASVTRPVIVRVWAAATVVESASATSVATVAVPYRHPIRCRRKDRAEVMGPSAWRYGEEEEREIGEMSEARADIAARDGRRASEMAGRAATAPARR